MRVENTTEHDITINGKGADGALVSVTVPAAKGLQQNRTNGTAEIDDKLVTELRAKDAVIKALFESGDLIQGGNRRVSVQDDEVARANADIDAAAARGTKGHGK